MNGRLFFAIPFLLLSLRATALAPTPPNGPQPPPPPPPPSEWQKLTGQEADDVRASVQTAIARAAFSDCLFDQATKALKQRVGEDWWANIPYWASGTPVERHVTGQPAIRMWVGDKPFSSAQESASDRYAEISIWLSPEDQPNQRVLAVSFISERWQNEVRFRGTVDRPERYVVTVVKESHSIECHAP